MDSDEFEASDNELNEETHKKLLENILNLSNKQHVKKASRTEPTLNISEFDLIKSDKNVKINDLTKALNAKAKHIKLGKQILNTDTWALRKPLEKPAADRIRRTVAYESAKKVLDRWEPVVTANRAAAQLRFPLETDVNLTNGDDIIDNFRMKSNLMKKLEALEPKTEIINVEMEEEFPLTLQEILEKRQEGAKLRAQQSYREAKARRQNKIKSKKYHRLMKREKIKKQLKEFELLQKTNPEAALEKLEEIERARAQERMSLRHKSTGQWAKNKQVRAKYDKESRQILAEQLAISRDLTQKIKTTGDDEDEDDFEATHTTKIDANNPWIDQRTIKISKEVDDFVSGYRKYWEEKNEMNAVAAEYKSEKNEDKEEAKTESKGVFKDEKTKIVGMIEKSFKSDSQGIQESLKKTKRKSLEDTTSKLSKIKKQDTLEEAISKQKTSEEVMSKPFQKKRQKMLEEKTSKLSKNKKQEISEETMQKPPKKKKSTLKSTSEWEVTEMNVEKAFNEVDFTLRQKLKQKYNKIVRDLKTEEKKKKKKSPNKSDPKPKIDLKLKKKTKKPVINESLNESTERNGKINSSPDLENMKKILKGPKTTTPVEDIDPNKFMKVKTTDLSFDTCLNDESDQEQKDFITEAFEDDDVVEDFNKEKQAEIDKNNPKSVDLSLPGWGSWGGKDVPIPKKKKRRFIMKFPKQMPRKDQNKGAVIINENGNASVRKHLVSEVPFPFKTVKDFEASMRAPIGQSFVPETAFRKLIAPPVITKMGAVIEPLTEDVLLKKK